MLGMDDSRYQRLEQKMKKRRHTPEEIIRKLRRVEVMLGQGKKKEEACRELGISDATYYKWRREYGGMGVSQAKKLKLLKWIMRA